MAHLGGVSQLIFNSETTTSIEKIQTRLDTISRHLGLAEDQQHVMWLRDTIRGDEIIPDFTRFYRREMLNGNKIEYLVDVDWAFVTFTFADGAQAYYEVNAEGSVREGGLPYPMQEYRFLVPKELFLEEYVEPHPPTIVQIFRLKYNKGITITYYPNGRAEYSIQARFKIDHQKREIELQSQVPVSGLLVFEFKNTRYVRTG